ncbi:MAG TPA: polysaccharide biosynthesis protein [Terracidiphilus sp.]|nr:polysaccharide biosynthesis protein [Terracidiphilus sp.]
MTVRQQAQIFNGKTLLITGGTGTFGNAVVDMATKAGFGEIRIFSRDEKKQDDMRERLKNPAVKFFIGDVRNYDSVLQATHGVNFVFHAAALKQVPSCEFFPIEAVRTNTLGAENVMKAALATGVHKVIVLSTDKAVYPVNAMGMSKALMEKCMVAKARMYGDTSTIFCGTRYGNVMASRGSVIPLFLKQIQAGEPLTVTDPKMTRFMMTIAGAVDLVLYAFVHGAPGDIFVKKAPSATIGTLARALIRLLNAANETRVIGTRHGEKLYETLLNREEMAHAQDLGDYYRVAADVRDLNYANFFSEGKAEVSAADDYNSHNAERLNEEDMINLLLQLKCVQDAVQGKEVFA